MLVAWSGRYVRLEYTLRARVVLPLPSRPYEGRGSIVTVGIGRRDKIVLEDELL